MKYAQKSLASNKKAYHDYFVEGYLEVGIVLVGTEVKSVKQGHITLKDAYAQIENNEVFLHNVHISPFKEGNIQNKDPVRIRKLLLNRNEITKLQKQTVERGYSLIPVSVYLSNGRVKIKLATAKGKRNYDKRQTLKAKDDKRRTEQALANY